jgi:protein-L-isoaspartate(D-aspartate) O-methyltransferase
MLAKKVISLERVPELAERARKTIESLGIVNVEIYTRDGTAGYPPGGPYQASLVTAAAPTVPQPLLDQLAEGGRLIIPVGRAAAAASGWQRVDSVRPGGHLPVVFVPLWEYMVKAP